MNLSVTPINLLSTLLNLMKSSLYAPTYHPLPPITFPTLIVSLSWCCNCMCRGPPLKALPLVLLISQFYAIQFKHWKLENAIEIT